jgi:hypothetical protein
MTVPTPPAVSDAMREAVEAHTRRLYGDDMPAWLIPFLHGLLAGPIASGIARLTGERDKALSDQRAMLIQVGEHALARGEAEGALWISEKAGIVEGWRARAEAAEAETARLRAALAEAEARGRRQGLEEAVDACAGITGALELATAIWNRRDATAPAETQKPETGESR